MNIMEEGKEEGTPVPPADPSKRSALCIELDASLPAMASAAAAALAAGSPSALEELSAMEKKARMVRVMRAVAHAVLRRWLLTWFLLLL